VHQLACGFELSLVKRGIERCERLREPPAADDLRDFFGLKEAGARSRACPAYLGPMDVFAAERYVSDAGMDPVATGGRR
jgi:hypothetical protein